MITTPLITKIKSSGGTLYTFTSTSKDLTRVATDNSTYSFKFSHFACLNLPHIMGGNSSLQNYTNFVDTNNFKSIKSYIQGTNFYIEIVLQRNIEQKLIHNECFVIIDNKRFQTISDNDVHKVTIAYDELKSNNFNFSVQLNLSNDEPIITTLSYNPFYVGNDIEKGLYLEQFDDYKFNSDDYNISMAEHFQNYILNFESVILNQPKFDSSILRSPAERIFFNWLRKVGGIKMIESTKDIYKEQLYTEDVSSYNNGIDKYLGRTVQYLGDIDIINQVNVNGDAFGEVYLYIPSSVGATPDINFRAITDNNYINDLYEWTSEIIVGRENFKKEDRPIDNIRLEAIYDNDDGRNFYLGDDGYCIDFRESSKIRDNNNNSYINFEFNCVLIYYDLIKSNSDGTTSSATNLYGVLFLDNFKSDNVLALNSNYLAHIDTLPKLRSSELDDGNSFALKLDLKIDTAPTTTMTRTEEGDLYSDPNDSRGFALYTSALEQLHKCMDIFYTHQQEIFKLQDRVEELESIIINQTDLKTLYDYVIRIDNVVKSDDFTNMTELKRHVTDISNKMEDILKGHIDISDIKNLTIGKYLASVKDKNSKATIINNTLQNYNYVGKVSLDTTNKVDNYLHIHTTNTNEDIIDFDLNNFTNLILLSKNEIMEIDDSNENGPSDESEHKPLIFNIISDDVVWEKGQSVKFIKCDDFNFNNIKHDKLRIITTIKNKVITIKEFNKSEIKNMKYIHELEVVCLNNNFDSTDNNFITLLK